MKGAAPTSPAHLAEVWDRVVARLRGCDLLSDEEAAALTFLRAHPRLGLLSADARLRRLQFEQLRPCARTSQQCGCVTTGRGRKQGAATRLR